MFSVEELLELIKLLDNKATFDNICDTLAKKRHRIIFSSDKSYIKQILIDDDNFIYDETLNIWKIKTKKEKIEKVKSNVIKSSTSGKIRVIKEVGNWKIFIKPWSKTDIRTVIRNADASVDISLKKNKGDNCRIWSSYPIPSLKLEKKSPAASEVRPYWYNVQKHQLHGIFKDLDPSLIKLLQNVDSLDKLIVT